MVVDAIGVAAILTGLARSWPQVLHIVNRPDVRGVSTSTWLLWLCAAVTWLIIGLVEHIAAIVVSNGLNALGGLTVLALLVRRHALSWWRPALTAVAAVAVNLAAYGAIGAAGPSVLGMGISISMFVPQAVTVLRRSIAGVSLLSWTLALVAATLWSVYGLLANEFVLVVPGLVMVPAAAVIVWRVGVGSRELRRLPSWSRDG